MQISNQIYEDYFIELILIDFFSVTLCAFSVQLCVSSFIYYTERHRGYTETHRELNRFKTFRINGC